MKLNTRTHREKARKIADREKKENHNRTYPSSPSLKKIASTLFFHAGKQTEPENLLRFSIGETDIGYAQSENNIEQTALLCSPTHLQAWKNNRPLRS